VEPEKQTKHVNTNEPNNPFAAITSAINMSVVIYMTTKEFLGIPMDSKGCLNRDSFESE
jgi:hypothetical protein